MTPRPSALRHADYALIEAVRTALVGVADAERAPKMQAYMKSTMPYLGVPAPILKLEMGALAKQHPPVSNEAWRDTALALFREATYREEWYASLNLAGRTPHRHAPASLPLFEEMVVTGAWWDVVDESAHRIGDILKRHRAEVTPILRGWISDPVL